jgi:hypothetical protein
VGPGIVAFDRHSGDAFMGMSDRAGAVFDVAA